MSMAFRSNLQKLVLPFHVVGPRNWTQLVSLSSCIFTGQAILPVILKRSNRNNLMTFSLAQGSTFLSLVWVSNTCNSICSNLVPDSTIFPDHFCTRLIPKSVQGFTFPMISSQTASTILYTRRLTQNFCFNVLPAMYYMLSATTRY